MVRAVVPRTYDSSCWLGDALPDNSEGAKQQCCELSATRSELYPSSTFLVSITTTASMRIPPSTEPYTHLRMRPNRAKPEDLRTNLSCSPARVMVANQRYTLTHAK